MTKAEPTLGGTRVETWWETSAPQPVLDLTRQLPPPFLLVSGDPALRGVPRRWSLVPSWGPATRVTVLHASCRDVRMAGRRPQRVMTSAFRGRQGIWKISIKISRTSKAFNSFSQFKVVPGLFSVGYFPIANFLKDISLSDKCPSEFLPIMDFYPLCFAHQEKNLPGLIPITILPIYLWIFTYHIFVHHRIAHQTRIN